MKTETKTITRPGCYFYEQAPGKWYAARRWSDTADCTTLGPFGTFAEALRSVESAGVGDFEVSALPGCKHDLLVRRERFASQCDRCGKVFG